MKVLIIGMKWFLCRKGRSDTIERYINYFLNTFKD